MKRRDRSDGGAGRAATLTARLAAFVARAALLLFPTAFRRDVGAQLEADVRARAEELGPWRTWLWLPRLAGSLVANAVGAWGDHRTGRRRPGGLARQPGTGRGGMAGVSWLDVRLGLRMLVKNPVLTLASVSGIAVAVAVSVGFSTFFLQNFYPDIPLDEGDRLVGLENWDLQRNNEDRRALFDFGVWRSEMRTVEDMAAFRSVMFTLPDDAGNVALVAVAEMSPSGFDLARVPPHLGRYLVDADARPGAAPVVGVGYDEWQDRFGGDPGLLGSDLRLGNVWRTVVGVMPPGFSFPINHQFWIPLTEDPGVERGAGPAVFVAGRLGPDVTMEEAQAEFGTLGARMASEFPDTHARYRAQLLPYAYPILDINQKGGESFFWEGLTIAMVMSLLLLVVCVNVAVLVYARTAMRAGEMAVRSALGASRSRIVGQLFAEGLVLSALGSAAGLFVATLGLELGLEIYEAEVGPVGLPFWMDLGVSSTVVGYVVFLTMLAAVVIGVLPGLRITRGDTAASLARFAGKGTLGLGGAWTAMIVIQVAASIAVLPVAMSFAWGEAATFARVPTYDPGAYVGASLLYDVEPPPGADADEYASGLAARSARMRDAVAGRLEGMPGVAGFSFADFSPIGRARTRFAFEADTTGARLRVVDFARVDLATFSNLGLRPIAGRGLDASDYGEGASPVLVVDRAFAELYIGSPSEAVGRRLARVTRSHPDSAPAPGPFHEIVGVVENVFTNPIEEDRIPAQTYFPMEGGWASHVLVRASNGDASSVAPALRQVLRDVAPDVRVMMETLEDVHRQDVVVIRLVGLGLGLTILATLLLTSAGIYALMSSTVTGRRREIGVRTALGARRAAVLGALFSRSAAQIGTGVAAGTTAYLGYVTFVAGDSVFDEVGLGALGVTVALMAVTGLAATWGPARRGLAIQPAEVLKSE